MVSPMVWQQPAARGRAGGNKATHKETTYTFSFTRADFFSSGFEMAGGRRLEQFKARHVRPFS